MLSLLAKFKKSDGLGRAAVIATVAVITTLIFTGCFFQTTEETPEAADSSYLTFRSEALGISFEYPVEWGDAIYEDNVSRTAFIMFDRQCVSKCKGVFVSKNTDIDLTAFQERLKKMYLNIDTQPQTEEKNSHFISKIEKTATDGAREEFVFTIHDKQKTLYKFTLPAVSAWLPNTPLSEETVRHEAFLKASVVFDRIAETFQVLPAKTAPATETAGTSTAPLADQGSEHKFDSCGSATKYVSESFFEDFKQQMAALPRYTKPSLIKVYGVTKFKTEDVAEACRSTKGNLFIALIPGEYCELGAILGYDTEMKKLTRADDNGAQESGDCNSSLKGFGKRKGNVIEVFGEFGDASIRANETFHYDYNANTLTLKKSCVKDYGVTDNPAAKCTEY